MRTFLLALDDQSAKQASPAQTAVRCVTRRDSCLYLGGALPKQGMENSRGSQASQESNPAFANGSCHCPHNLLGQMRSMPWRDRERRWTRRGHVLPSTSEPDRRQEDEHRHRRRTFLRNQRGKKTDAFFHEKTFRRAALATRVAGTVLRLFRFVESLNGISKIVAADISS
jgi:hypothetical protein